MAERMGVDVRQPVVDSELFQPVRDRIRVHGLSVVLSKHEVLIAVVFPQTEAFGGLPCSVFSQKLHRFHRQGDEPFRPFRLRCAFVNPDIGRIQDAAANVNSVCFKVYLIPFQTEDFAPACARNEKQMHKAFPLDWLLLQRFPDSRHLFRLEIVDLFTLYFGQIGTAGGVERYKG